MDDELEDESLSYFPARNWAEELVCTAIAGRLNLRSRTACRNGRDKAESNQVVSLEQVLTYT